MPMAVKILVLLVPVAAVWYGFILYAFFRYRFLRQEELAYVLAAALAEARGNHVQAFERYERALMPFLRSKQKAAVRLAPAFAPRGAVQLFLRNSLMKLFNVPLVARLVMGNSLRDAIDLPSPPPAA